MANLAESMRQLVGEIARRKAQAPPLPPYPMQPDLTATQQGRIEVPPGYGLARASSNSCRSRS